jgi:signal peptidase II
VNRRLIFFAATIDGILMTDQISKFIVDKQIPLGDTIPLLPFFSLTHVRNTGAAFGLGQGGNAYFIAMALAIVAGLFYVGRDWIRQSRAQALGLALTIGGAAGNLIDRIFRGSVVDFLDFHWRGWHWPAFNVADSAVCVGVAVLIFFSRAPDAPAAPVKN